MGAVTAHGDRPCRADRPTLRYDKPKCQSNEYNEHHNCGAGFADRVRMSDVAKNFLQEVGRAEHNQADLEDG